MIQTNNKRQWGPHSNRALYKKRRKRVLWAFLPNLQLEWGFILPTGSVLIPLLFHSWSTSPWFLLLRVELPRVQPIRKDQIQTQGRAQGPMLRRDCVWQIRDHYRSENADGTILSPASSIWEVGLRILLHLSWAIQTCSCILEQPVFGWGSSANVIGGGCNTSRDWYQIYQSRVVNEDFNLSTGSKQCQLECD